MTTPKILDIELFTRRELGQGIYYLSAELDRYEITIEPHLTAGFTVAVYDKKDPWLSIQKRAVWKYNHPTTNIKHSIEQELISRALEIAQYYYEFYELNNKKAQPPVIGGKPIKK